MLTSRFRSLTLYLLTTLAFGLLGSSPLWACYAVVVGRAASADGSVLVGHNEENGGERVLWFHKIPRQQHPAGAVVRLEAGGQLDQVPETWACLWSENPGLGYSDGYLNEWGVAVVSDGCPTREDGYAELVQRGEIREGGIGYMLRRLVALRAKTARQGVELIGQLVERFGYADSGRTYVVADPQEAWLVAVVRGRRWVAQRVPDDKVVILPNVHIIGEVDLADADNFRGSADLISYAVARGWFDPDRGEPFSFRGVYQKPGRLAPDRRQFRVQEMVTGRAMTWPPGEPLPFAVTPHKKLAVPDVVAVLRNREGLVPLFGKTTQESAVFQLRAALPAEIGCIYWRTACRPDVSVLTPWYVGVTSTPNECGRRPVELATLLSLEHHFQPPPSTFAPDPRLAWWKFRHLAAFVDEDYAPRIEPVRAAWSNMEQRLFREQASLEAEALDLWRTDPDAARELLTQYSAKVAAEAHALADKYGNTDGH
jgi:dipeptidase